MAVSSSSSRAPMRGFTLLELAIVLTIIAIIMGGGLSLYTERLLVEKVRDSNSRLDRVEEALKLYVQTFGTLPCPMVSNVGTEQSASSTPALPAGVNAFGRQTCDVTKHPATQVITPPVAADQTRSDGTTVRRVIVGGVPTRTLGLPDIYAFDGWNNRFMYGVDNEYSYASAAGTTSPQWGTKNGVITIRAFNDSDEKTNCGGDCTGQAGGVYVLYSFGQNGYGAWRANATTTSTRNVNPAIGTIAGNGTGSPGGREIENAHIVAAGPLQMDTIFRDTLPKQSDSANTYFDDLVRWKTKQQF